MSRFALEWAKAQNPGDAEAKVLLLVLADQGEGWSASSRFLEANLAWATDISRADLPAVISRLEVGGYVKSKLVPRDTDAPAMKRNRECQASTWGDSYLFELLIPHDWTVGARAPRPSYGDGNCEPTAVYRLYDAKGVLLYVGIGRYPHSRFEQHALHKHWWFKVRTREINWHSDRLTALAEEERAIEVECPIYNIHHAPDAKEKKATAPKAKYLVASGRRARFWETFARISVAIDAGDYDNEPLTDLAKLGRRFDVEARLLKQVLWMMRDLGILEAATDENS